MKKNNIEGFNFSAVGLSVLTAAGALKSALSMPVSKIFVKNPTLKENVKKYKCVSKNIKKQAVLYALVYYECIFF